MVILPISIRPPTEVIHGKETGNKIPRGQEIQHHKVANEKPNGARGEGDATTHNSSQENRSGARKEAFYSALDEDADSTPRLREETSQSNSAGDGVHQPKHAYLVVLSGGSARFSEKVTAGRLHRHPARCAEG
jgi:hypothetical protein